MEKKKYIFGMDAFRGLAAFLVLLFHFREFFWREQSFFGDSIFKAGHLGVDMFFVLSGFLIFLSCTHHLHFFEEQKAEKKDYLAFWQKRFWRIFPLAAFFVLTVFVAQMDFSSFEIKNFLVHLFFLQSLYPAFYHELHPVMWTLTVEVLFYILLPVIIFLSQKKVKRFWFILVNLLLLNFFYRALVFQFFPDWSMSERIFYSEQLWGRFDQFFLGILLGSIWYWQEKYKKIWQSLSPFLLFISLLAFAFCYYAFASLASQFRESMFLQISLHFFVALAFAGFLLGYLFLDEKWQKNIAPTWLNFLGKISYGVYLWHYPIQSFSKKFLAQINLLDSNLAIIITLIIDIILTIFLSYLSYEFIEKYFLKKFAKRKSLAK